MKNNQIKALSLGVSAAVVASIGSISYAGTPVAFENWTVDLTGASAVVQTVCPTGFTCSVIATDDGFLQRNVDNGIDTFVQTIVTPRKLQMDAALNGATSGTFNDFTFADESFVRMAAIGSGGSSAGGIANRSHTGNRNAAGQFDFVQTGTLLTGSFWSTGDAAKGLSNFDITQTVASGDAVALGTSASDFFTSFKFSQISTAMGATAAEEGTNLNIAQATHDTPLTKNQKQAFVFSRVTSPIAIAGALTSQTLFAKEGTAVTGPTTAQVEAVWIGQNFGAAGFGVEQVRDTTGGGFNEIHSKTSFATVGFSGTVANGGFDWNTLLGEGVYAPSF